jgi:hypothetical protein
MWGGEAILEKLPFILQVEIMVREINCSGLLVVQQLLFSISNANYVCIYDYVFIYELMEMSDFKTDFDWYILKHLLPSRSVLIFQLFF